MVLANMHVHTNYSWDAKIELDNLIEILKKGNVRYIALTDHVELDREDINDVLRKLTIRNNEIDRINEQNCDKVTLLKGVEISSPHLYKEQVLRLNELNLDFMMGSIHNIDSTAKTNCDKTRAFYKYYKDLYEMVSAKQVDTIGHIDYIKRYYNGDYACLNQIYELFEAIIEAKQTIEINTSAKRRCNLNTFPSVNKLCTYKLCGGKYVTTGSDAHDYDEVFDNLETSDGIIKEIGLQQVIYKKRKIEII